MKKSSITIKTNDETKNKIFNLVRKNPKYCHLTASSWINGIINKELQRIQNEENETT